MATTKGFIKDYNGNILLPITRAELLLDRNGQMALQSMEFLASDKHPGLMSPTEKAMLQGTAGNSLADLYTRVDYINTGLQVNDTPLKFFTVTEETNVLTQHKIKINSSDTIEASVSNQTITFDLKEIGAKSIESTFIRNITIDKYGRVTSVSGSNLDSNDMPSTMNGINFTNCTTTTEPYSDNSIVNKTYVDNAVLEATGVATGALKFSGVITSLDEVNSYLNSAKGSYYKITSPTSITISADKMYSANNTAKDTIVKLGDTLIVHNDGTANKYVHIPSGDEETTTITVENGEQTIINQQLRDITLNFSSLFNVTGGNRTAYIDLPKAGENSSGFLSKEDFIKFNSYSDTLNITYSPTVTNSTEGYYEIGKISIGNQTPISIYGVNNITELNVISGSDGKNPKLQFKETDKSNKDIVFKGNTGINITNEGNNIEFTLNNVVDTNSTDYLIINENKFGVKLGSGSGESLKNGLVDYATFNQFEQSVYNFIQRTHFINIDYSLNSDTTPGVNDPYRYGNDSLKSAINITI